jgi:hypothetical protein
MYSEVYGDRDMDLLEPARGDLAELSGGSSCKAGRG